MSEELERILPAARQFAGDGEELSGIVVAEPREGTRVYLCAFRAGERRSWLALDGRGVPVTSRRLVREAASIAALVEIAEEAAEHIDDAQRVASLAYLDSIGGDSSLAAALPAVDELTRDVETHYKLELS